MNTAKVFSNGGSQAIRLPKECRFDAEEVAVSRIGKIVVLSPTDAPWSSIQHAFELFTDDFLDGDRTDLPMQKREGL